MDVSRRKYCFISSASRSSGTTSSYRVNAPGSIKCGDAERLRVTLMQFSMFNTWQSIKASNNSIVLTNLSTGAGISVTVPPGNYTMTQLASALSQLYPVTVAYNTQANGFRFTFATPHSITFLGSSYKTLGFDGAPISGAVIESNTSVQLAVLSTIVVHLLDATPTLESANLDNYSSANHLDISNVLLSLPVNTQPYDMITYENGMGHYELDIAEKKLESIRLFITDASGNELVGLNDHYITLRIETMVQASEKELLNALGDIKKINHMQLMQSTLGN